MIFKDSNIPENYKTRMSFFSKNCTIVFLEKGTGEKVNLNFVIENKERGFYSEEYVSDNWKDAKRIDITCGLVDEKRKKIRYKLYDVKTKLHSEDMIVKFYQQLHDGYRAFLKEILEKCVGFEQEKELGACTTYFDVGEIKRRANAMKKRITEIEISRNSINPIGIIKSSQDLRKKELILQTMNQLIDKQFLYKEEHYKENIDLTIRMMSVDENGHGYCKIEV